MRLVLNKSSIVFNNVDMMAILSEQYNNFNRSAFEEFMATIGGESGSIWNKIQLLYMPIFSSGSEAEPLYFDVKSCTIKKPSVNASAYWERINDAIMPKVYGYKGVTSVDSHSMGVDVSGMGLTTRNTCLFGALNGNPYPSSSLSWVSISTDNTEITFSISQTTNGYRIFNRQLGTEYVTVAKETSGFGQVSSVVMSQEGGEMGICGTLGKSHSENTIEETEVKLFEMAAKNQPSTNSYGALVTIQGIAKSLTYAEADTLRIAIDNLVNKMAL